ncbi:MAG: hypothetical protein BWK79_01365 [Beggiatoa sp. IS2]|nr:MAG: hypothetical protein BWK79_01365 [Beggiatoa sp. IS2]
MKNAWLSPSEALNRPFTRQADDFTIHEFHAEVTRRLGFRIGNIGLLIAPRATSELTELLSVCPIPNTASWLCGLINLRGNLVPVFDLHKLLDLDSDESGVKAVKKPMLLILGQGETAGAIKIDNLPIHINLTLGDSLESLPPLPDALKPYATSGYEKNDDIWFNFDHFGFFHSLSSKIAI